jgi:nitroreductase
MQASWPQVLTVFYFLRNIAQPTIIFLKFQGVPNKHIVANHYNATCAHPMPSPILTAIKQRRSIRDFTAQPVDPAILHEIIQAGVWAPSGLNNQPWRFVIVADAAIRASLAEQTHYGHIILAAPALIAVYLDREAMYDELKDAQSAGACIQNMLLAAEAFGLGAVWLGQILKNSEKVSQILSLTANLELMAVIAIGHPGRRDQQSQRKPLAEFIIKEV